MKLFKSIESVLSKITEELFQRAPIPTSLYIALALSFSLTFLFTDKNEFFDSKNNQYFVLAQNIQAGKGISLFHHYKGQKVYFFDKNAKTYPTAYIPPAYSVLIVPAVASGFRDVSFYFVLMMNSFGVAFVMLLLFRLIAELFTPRVAFYGAVLYVLMPYTINSAGLRGFIIFAQLAILFPMFLEICVFKDKPNSGIMMLFLALSVYFRFEAAILLYLYLLFLIYRGNFAAAKKLFVVTAIVLAPWMIRNAIVFNGNVIISSAEGVNLLRGNNNEIPGFKADFDLFPIIDAYSQSDNFEGEMNRICYYQGFKNIFTNIDSMPKNAITKLSQLLLYNPQDKNVLTNIVAIISWMFLVILSALGLTQTGMQKYINVIYLMSGTLIFLTLLFFGLPYYKDLLLVAFTPFAALGIAVIIDLFKKNKDSLQTLN